MKVTSDGEGVTGKMSPEVAISTLTKIEREKHMKNEFHVIDDEKLPFQLKKKLIGLVGERPLVNVFLNEVKSRCLWDTGAMISLINEDMLESFPEVKMLSVEEFTGSRNFELTTANQCSLSVKGVVILSFGLEKGKNMFEVPFLVTEENISNPIIGYNIIEHVVLNFKDMDLPGILSKTVLNVSKVNAESVVNIVELGSGAVDKEREVKCIKDEELPPGGSIYVKCKMEKLNIGPHKTISFSPHAEFMSETDLVLFDSVESPSGNKRSMNVLIYNPTKNHIRIKRGTAVGSVSEVWSAFSMPVSPARVEQVMVKTGFEENGNSGNELRDENGFVEETDFDEKGIFDLRHLAWEEREKVKLMLDDVKDVFGKDENDIGEISDFYLDIKLTDEIPVAEPYRRIPKNLYQEVKDHISNLLAKGWVRRSYSAYSSPMVCVRKKSGGLRLCCDFRKLNKKMIPDRHPIPRVQDILDNLKGKAWFSNLDFSQAYHQGKVREESRKYTAFATPWMLLEWCVIPYGLMTAPGAFQRFINDCLQDLRDTICTAYLDDVLTFSKTFEDHLVDVKKVLVCLQRRGVKLNAKKCEFFKKEIRYLGRLISSKGYRPDPEDVKALEKCKIPPKTVGNLRSIIGFLSYYRTYIEKFSLKMKPIYDLLQKGKDGKNVDSRTKVVWEAKHQQIIEEMVNYLGSPEVIAYPDFSLPFIVHCDASQIGIGGVLYQIQEGKKRVISFASRTLTPAEKNYHLHSGKLEFLALKWAVAEKFRDYLLYGPPFQVITDNNPLTYVQTTAKLNATGLRWISELANFKFEIKYRAGKRHIDADYLSRHPIECSRENPNESDREIGVGDVNLIFLEAATREKMVRASYIEEIEVVNEVVAIKVSNEELKEEQKRDDVIGPVYRAIMVGTMTKEDRRMLPKKSKVLYKQQKRLMIKDGVLLRKTATATQIVLPLKYHEVVYHEYHEKLAHLAADRVFELVRKKFYWPNSMHDIEEYIKKRCRCLISKKPNIKEKAELVPIVSTYPFEILSFDFVHLDKCRGGYEYALVVVDHFTKWVQIYATKNKSAISAADKIFNNYILKYGFPKRLHHDQGKEFDNTLFARLRKLSGVGRSRTTGYHPEGNGITERMNKTLINMLKTLSEEEKKNWSESLGKLAFAYNVTKHKTTGFSPYYLMFGRDPILPMDNVFEISEEGEKIRKSYDKYAEEWKMSMNQAFEIVQKNSEKKRGEAKKHYDQKAKAIEIGIGDRILIRNREKGGTGKLRNFWEEEIYIVTSKDDDIPVYSVEPERGGKTKRIHRNNMLKCELLKMPEKEDVKKNLKKTKKKNRLPEKKMTSSDSESEAFVVMQEREDFGDVESNVESLHEESDVESDVESLHEESESEQSSESEGNRRSRRNRWPTKRFTYDEIGGEPSYA